MSTLGKQTIQALRVSAFPIVIWIWTVSTFDFICDDAFISFRYAANLANGDGLAYDAVRSAPVEGYSNFLWVLWLSLFERAGVDITAAARWSSLLAGCALLIGTIRLAMRRLNPDAGHAQAVGLFLATLPAFGLWSTGGLATMPSALAIFGVLSALHGDREGPRAVPAIAWAVTATLLRADGIGYVGLILAATFAAASADPSSRQRMRSAVLITASAAATALVAHTVWRHGYYGEWVPNTAKIKAGLSSARLHRGLLYVGAYLVAMPAVVLGVGVGLRRWREGPTPLLITCTTLIVGSFGYAVWVGGDFMPFGRFLVPALPAVALLFAWGESRLRKNAAFLLLMICLLFSMSEINDKGLAPDGLRRSLHFRQDREFQTEVARWQEMKKNAAAWDLWGRALAQETEPGESIILGGIGAIGYRAPHLTVYDTYGLVTPEVAANTEPIEGASPGHDVRVQNDFFLRPEILKALPSEPTYLGAQVGLARALSPEEAAPDWLLTPFPAEAYLEKLTQHLSRNFGVRLEVLKRPLLVKDGFPEDSVLHLLRLHYD